MHSHFCVRVARLVLGLLICAAVTYSQPAPNPAPSPTPLQIIYTGKLLGYFRLPSSQNGRDSAVFTGCQAPLSGGSEAAKKFFAERNEHPNAILVGAGDNFSPQLEARVFDPAPSRTDSGIDSQDYAPGNKELYLWYQPTGAKPKGDPGNDRWVFYKPAEKIDELQERIKKGIATIPTDNVGCFLYQARFAAVVPGKHDFYFGAERVRLLARFMASLSSSGEIEPPQMLGANLVIKTARTDGAAPVPDQKNLTNMTWGWPSDEMNSELKFRDKKLVYPWFSTVRRTVALRRPNIQDNLELWFSKHEGPVAANDLQQYLDALVFRDKEDDAERLKLHNTIEAFSRDQFFVCPAEGNYENMALPTTAGTTCRLFPVREIRLENKTLVESASVLPDALLQNGKHKHFSTVQYGKNYGLCVVRKDKQDIKKGETYCRHFSVYTPFFTYPREVPQSVTGSYTDPDPFVFVSNAEPNNAVAIFGVVDPNLGEQVGVLNFSWLNQNDELKTVVGIEDPAEALRQQLDYFDQKYKAEHSQQEFSGLKILLAQMSPQRARVLAARFPEFQLVVTEADDEQATVEISQQSTWTAARRRGTFVAVPSKSFDDVGKSPRTTLGVIEASTDAVVCGDSEKDKSEKERSWVLSAKAQTPEIVTEELKSQDAKLVGENSQNDKTFANKIGPILRRCASLTDEKVKKLDKLDRVRWLTLCAIRERTGADVALLQKRDFFPGAVPDGEVTAAQLQQTLDRIIWKGDLLTLLFVPGSSIKKAMDQSKKYEADDTNILSLSDEKNRGLEYLGVYFDGEQYVVNEMPLEDKRIYTVATTDYIGAGDTGYPDFKAAALNPRTLAPQFPQKLDIISAIVCRKLFDSKAKANEYCLPGLQRDLYLDPAIAEAADPKKSNVFARLWAMTPFKLPPKSRITDPIQEQAQQRPIWTLSLHNFSVGFDGLTKNLSDAEIAQKFAGIPTTGITTQQNSSVTAQLDVGLSRTSHENELFLNFGADFKQRSTGDVAPQILQIKNRGTGDIGIFRSLAGGRSQTRVGLALYLHAEAPLQKPFSTFTLSAQDRLRITQDRNFSILPRAGLRWLNRGNSFEGGIQAGREINAFSGYRFSTNGDIVLCTPSSTETFAACVNRLIKAGTVTKDSVASAILENRPRAGFYSRINLTIPITAQAKYVFNEDGDFFFNFHGDNSIDTRLRDISKHSLKFNIWPSFSIGPTLQILLYRNKVNGDFLFQRQFGFETSLSFDLFNRREKMVQIRHKP